VDFPKSEFGRSLTTFAKFTRLKRLKTSHRNCAVAPSLTNQGTRAAGDDLLTLSIRRAAPTPHANGAATVRERLLSSRSVVGYMDRPALG
jgi:hypothetical protein